MSVPINYLAVVVSMVISMVLGTLWYGPLFGKQWMALMGIHKEAMTPEMKKTMYKSYGFLAIGSFVMAYVLAHSLVFASSYLDVSGVSAGLQGGFWNWLGFIAPVTLGSVLWEKKPWKLWFLNNGYQLINLLIVGVVLATWM